MKKLLLLAAAAWLSVLSLQAQTYTVTSNTTTYSAAGGQVSFTVNLAYPTGSIPLFEAKPPASTWAHVGTAGTNVPTVLPNAGETTDAADPNSKWGWTYQEPPTSPASFTFTVSYPAGLSGNQVVSFNGNYRLNNVATAVTIAAITLTPTPVAPSFTTQPANQTVVSGQNATFTAAATGVPAPTLKWQRSTDGGATWANIDDGSAFGGTTTGTLTVNAVTLANTNHRFRAVAASTGFGPVNSNAAILTVTQVPQISQQPVSQSALAGGSATFNVVASGSGTITYKWYFTGTAAGSTPQLIPNATTSTLTLNNVQAANQGDYVVVLNNGVGGDVTSNAASLTIVSRLVRVGSQTAAPATNVVVPIQLVASGNENAVSFTLEFPAAKLSYVDSTITGTDSASGTMVRNVTQAASGKLSYAISLASGTSYTAGTRTLVNITFAVNAAVADGEVLAVTFTDALAVRKITDPAPLVLNGPFVAGDVTVSSGLEGDVNGDGVVDLSDWVKLGRMVVGLDASPTSGGPFMKTDCAPRATRGDGVVDLSDWVQAGRFVVGLDTPQNAGGPSAPVAP